MKARYVQRGESIDYTPTADVAAGDVIRLGKMIGVSKLDIKSGELGALALVGVYELAVKSGKAFSVGQTAYYNPTDGTISPDTPVEGSGEFAIGYAIAAVASGDATGLIRLTQGL